jgi:hypothetical protein
MGTAGEFLSARRMADKVLGQKADQSVPFLF